jgi:cobalt/nickel transport system ATP-binding protein
MSSPILAVHGLEYVYPGGIQALKGLDLTITKGRKLALLGFNGCGKTTLLLHLNGTLKPRRGTITIDGQPAAYDRRARTVWRGRVGLVLQEPDDQLFSASVYQDVSFGPLNLGLSEPEVRARIKESLDALQIGHLAERATHMLSFGQKKRVAIAGILAMRPEILILDEPNAGLDPCGVTQLLAALQRLHALGTTLVFSTHDVDLAYAWADEVAIFGEGTVLRQGAAVEVLADRELLRAAGLKAPLILELAQELLGEAGDWPTGGPPRSRAALLAVIRATVNRLKANREVELFCQPRRVGLLKSKP